MNIGRILLLILFPAYLTALSGCSLIGLMVGLNHDRNIENVIHVNKNDIADLSLGKTINIMLRDSIIISGTFEGTEKLTDAQYAELYVTCMKNKLTSFYLPPLDKIKFYEKNGSLKSAFELKGFDDQGMLLNDLAASKQGIVGYHIISQYVVVDNNGHNLDIDVLKAHVLSGEIPSHYVLKLDKKATGTNCINYSEISDVTFSNHKYGTLTGLSLGLAIDAALVYYFWIRPTSQIADAISN